MFYLPGITLCILFLIYQKRNKWKLGPVSILFIAYLGMFLAATIGYLLSLSRPVLPISLHAMLYLSAAFIIIFLGYFGFDDNKNETIVIENSLVYSFLEYLLIAYGILAFIFFTPFSIISLQGDIEHNRIVNINFAALESFGLINSFASLFANVFIYMLLFAFINFAKNEKRAIIRGFILLVCSQSFIVYILAYVGRDGSVYWFMSLVFIAFLMKDFITKELKRIIILVSLLLTILAFIPFMMITLSRFSDGSKSNIPNDMMITPSQFSDGSKSNIPNDMMITPSQFSDGSKSIILNKKMFQDMKYFFVIETIVNYSGQQISNFNDIFVINPPKRWGGLSFPVITTFLESLGLKINAIYDNEKLYSHYFEYGATPWVFSTYIGSLLADFGRLGTIVYLFISTLFTMAITSKSRNTGKFYLSELVVFILLYQIVYWGIFYFRHYSMNYYMLGVFLLCFFIKFTQSHKNQVQIDKLK